MRLHILSDLHIEFTSFKYRPKKNWPEADILILAGDIGTGKSARNFIQEQTRTKKVIYVLGNHEFYNHNMTEVRNYWKNLDMENLYVLDNNYVDLGNYRFIGSTLWSDTSGPRIPMNDFVSIEFFSQEIGTAMYENNVLWLENTIDNSDKDCIVITHHLPSFECVPDDSFKKGYASNLHHLLKKENVKLWIHGHTHQSIDRMIETTRVVCNPRGYNTRGKFENENFDEQFVINI